MTPLFPPATYWCAVVSCFDRSGLLGVYGPYPTEDAAEAASGQLRVAGVHPDQLWETRRLHLIDLGELND